MAEPTLKLHQQNGTPDPPTGTDPLLIDAAALARMLSLSVRTLRRMDVDGGIPGRVVIGRRVLFKMEVIREWVRAGCPDRARWEAMQRARR